MTFAKGQSEEVGNSSAIHLLKSNLIDIFTFPMELDEANEFVELSNVVSTAT